MAKDEIREILMAAMFVIKYPGVIVLNDFDASSLLPLLVHRLNIYTDPRIPMSVEEKLYEHTAVLEAGVVGVPDPTIGETIKAFVVLKREFRGKVTESEIIEWAKEKLAGYKYPRHIEFLISLPRTAVGKIFRRKLREREDKKENQ